MYERTNGGPWGHPTDPVTGEPYQEDTAFTMYGTPTGPGEITSIRPSTSPRSGFVRLSGRNFASGGTLTIGGHDAVTTYWDDDEIRGYVPEAASLGMNNVTVTTSGGVSTPAAMEVVPRAPDGRLLWRVELDGWYSQVRPALAADGTVYAVEVFNKLHAFTADGALKWLAAGAGGKGVDTGPDGKVYVGTEAMIKAYNPDGALAWVFEQDPRAFIFLGPNVGPDGNVYGVASNGMGVLSLTPEGALRWQTPEPYTRPIVDYAEVVFGQNGSKLQLYFWANRHLRALEAKGGNERFVHVEPDWDQPVVAPDDSVHVPDRAYGPGGDLLWQLPFLPSLLSAPDVGPDNVHYVVYSKDQLFAFDDQGNELWNHVLDDLCYKAPNVSPANDLVLLGTCLTLDQPNHLVAVSTADGAELWRVTFGPVEDGRNQFIDSRVRFSPDGSRAYIMTAVAEEGSEPGRVWLNAIDLGPCAGPGEVSGLRYGAGKVRLEWNATHPGDVYDVGRGSLSELRTGAPAACLAEAVPDPFFDDPETPLSGEGFYYLVRAENTCGLGPWGTSSDGAPRAVGCP